MEYVAGIAIEVPDSSFLGERVRVLFREDEVISILQIVETELVPELKSIVSSWEDNFSSSEEAEDYYQPLGEAFEQYAAEFQTRGWSASWYERAVSLIDNSIEELHDRYPSDEDDEAGYYSHNDQLEWDGGRSVFDDVDS